MQIERFIDTDTLVLPFCRFIIFFPSQLIFFPQFTFLSASRCFPNLPPLISNNQHENNYRKYTTQAERLGSSRVQYFNRGAWNRIAKKTRKDKYYSSPVINFKSGGRSAEISRSKKILCFSARAPPLFLPKTTTKTIIRICR